MIWKWLSRKLIPGRLIREKLGRASRYLPADTPNPVVDQHTDEYRLKHFHEFLEHNEYGLALGVLIYIADACEKEEINVPTQFWVQASGLAKEMKMTEEAERCYSSIKNGEIEEAGA